VQRYENGVSGIARHADKGLDMIPDSDILIYRVNREVEKTRALVVACKDGSDETRFDMPSHSMLRMTAAENKRMVHWVPEQEDGATDVCYSFVLRRIGTFHNAARDICYGVGAKCPTFEDRLRAMTSIVDMYRFENTHDLTCEDPEPYYAAVRAQTW
jgi:hypothetical protein